MRYREKNQAQANRQLTRLVEAYGKGSGNRLLLYRVYRVAERESVKQIQRRSPW